jgi:hypothetical protein
MNSRKTEDLIAFFSVHIFILLFANLCNLMTVKGFFLVSKLNLLIFFVITLLKLRFGIFKFNFVKLNNTFSPFFFL